MERLCREPYRLFFPIGIAYGFWGVALWLLYGFKMISVYPGPLHMQMMVGGFLGAFAFGFLTTILPRFTRAAPAQPFELAWIAGPLLIGPLLWGGASRLFLPALTISFLGMTVYAGSRWWRGASRPPDPFILIGHGLIAALAGLILQQIPFADPRWTLLGRLLFLRAFMLLVIVGVGGQLIPMLLGGAPAAGCMRSPRARNNRFLYLGLALLSAFFIEALMWGDLGRVLQAVIVAAVALKHWRIFQLPIARSKLAWILWTSCWFLVTGLAGEALFPRYAVHFLHLSFIGGLALTSMMVATRLVLAHGGFSLMLETRLQSLYWAGGFVLTASVTRLAAGFIPAAYEHHLTYAALLWLMGLSIWAVVVGRKIAQTRWP
jgi:uncharacterized protein involved in response to NO